MLRRCGYDGRISIDRRRHRLAVRSPEPLEGLSRRERAGRMDSAAARRISTPSIASRSCAATRRASTSTAKTVEVEGREPHRVRRAAARAPAPSRFACTIPGADLPHVHYAAHARRQPRDHRGGEEREARRRHRLELHRPRGRGVASRAQHRRRRRRARRRSARRACSAITSANSFERFTNRTACASTSAASRSASRRDAVVLDDGTRLAADLVVMGVGVRPRLRARRDRRDWRSIEASSVNE